MPDDLDFDDDAHDGVLFRFWIRGASEFPGELAAAITRCKTPAEYRRALIGVAKAKGINLPPPGVGLGGIREAVDNL